MDFLGSLEYYFSFSGGRTLHSSAKFLRFSADTKFNVIAVGEFETSKYR
jgi:hypothetical protein